MVQYKEYLRDFRRRDRRHPLYVEQRGKVGGFQGRGP